MQKISIDLRSTKAVLQVLKNSKFSLTRPTALHSGAEILAKDSLIQVGRDLSFPRTALFHEFGHALDMSKNMEKLKAMSATEKANNILAEERGANTEAIKFMASIRTKPAKIVEYAKNIEGPYRSHRGGFVLDRAHARAKEIAKAHPGTFTTAQKLIDESRKRQLSPTPRMSLNLMSRDKAYHNIIRQVSKQYKDELSLPAMDPMLHRALGLSKKAGILDNINYAIYVTKHKANVISPMMQMGLPITQALKHDLDKYSPKKFGPYRDWFEGDKGEKGSKDPKTYATWRSAVKRHYKDNMHHWSKRGLKPSNVPLRYKMEQVADWYSVGKTNSKAKVFPSFSKWYKARRMKLPIENMVRHEIDLALKDK